jgi:hypothetical protein
MKQTLETLERVAIKLHNEFRDQMQWIKQRVPKKRLETKVPTSTSTPNLLRVLCRLQQGN